MTYRKAKRRAGTMGGRHKHPAKGRGPRQFYTTVLIAQIRLYAEEGLSAGRIAKLINRTRGSVAGLCYRQGIRLRGEDGAPFGNQNRKKDKANVNTSPRKADPSGTHKGIGNFGGEYDGHL